MAINLQHLVNRYHYYTTLKEKRTSKSDKKFLDEQIKGTEKLIVKAVLNSNGKDALKQILLKGD